MTDEELAAYWFKPDTRVFEATRGGETVGTAYLRPNQPGRGDHVANAGFAVGAAHRGKGIARAMCRYMLEAAREQGYSAMQFNFVVSTNAPAVKLWEDFGFATIGVIPGGFRHPERGEVDVYIMHRKIL
jgi:GNAT superfamily N-acetyltransferase